MRILLFGATGQLGSTFAEQAFHWTNRDHTVVSVTRAMVDFSGTSDSVYYKLTDLIRIVNPQVIVNCAAYTDVAGAEIDASGASRINYTAVELLERVISDYQYATGAKLLLIHISTDYVYGDSGLHNITQPIDVRMLPRHYDSINNKYENPKNVYGKTKLDGDRALLSRKNVSTYVIRTSGLYRERGNNIFTKIANSTKDMYFYDDVWNVPTPTYLVSNVIWKLVSEWYEYAYTLVSEVLHVAPCIYMDAAGVHPPSWYTFAKEVVKHVDTGIKIHPIKYTGNNVVPINTYSVLLPTSLSHFTFPFWDDCVQLTAKKFEGVL